MHSYWNIRPFSQLNAGSTLSVIVGTNISFSAIFYHTLSVFIDLGITMDHISDQNDQLSMEVSNARYLCTRPRLAQENDRDPSKKQPCNNTNMTKNWLIQPSLPPHTQKNHSHTVTRRFSQTILERQSLTFNICSDRSHCHSCALVLVTFIIC